MARISTLSRRWCASFVTHFRRGCSGNALWFFLAVLTVLHTLTHELSRHSALAAAADFEGFNSEDAEDDDDSSAEPFLFSSTPPTTLTQTSTPESHHGSPDTEPAPTQTSDPIKAPSPPFPEWDEDEFEGIPTQIEDQIPETIEEAPSTSPEAVLTRSVEKPEAFLKSYALEIACVSFLITFVVNYFTGRKENENLALAWAAKFAVKDSIFDRNFSLLGTGDGKDTPLLLKEGQDMFKFYASGRRFCQGLLATMEMKSRHDLISRIYDLVMPRQDTITFEVLMNEDGMDHVVFALAKKKLAKMMQKEERDLQRYTALVTTPPAGKKWVAEELMVITESKEVAGDLLTDAVLDQVFGDKAFEKFRKGFISLHFSDQHPGSHKKVLLFKFALPDARNMSEMTRLVALVPCYIDLIGRYKLSSQAHSKTDASRAKAAQEAYRELQNARQEALQKKKADKRKIPEEIETKLSAEAVRKKEEKERARLMKKAGPKVKMLRSH